jgi:hypothetical protein
VSDCADGERVSERIRFRYEANCHKCKAPINVGTLATWDRVTKTAACLKCTAPTPTGPAVVYEPVEELVEPTETASAIRLRYPAACSACGASMPPGTVARWDKTAKQAEHVSCPAPDPPTAPTEPVVAPAPPDAGIAGGSARKIADRQQAKRDRMKQQHDDAIRQAHPRIGSVLVKTRDILAERERPTSWQKGADGEEAAGRTFDRLTPEGFAVLHDRRKPGTKWNVDHVVVGPRGVYVIDAKHYSGRLEIRSTGSFFRPGPNRVFVKGRAQDKRVAAMDWQVGWVRDAAGDLIDDLGGVLKPVLCFIGVELGLTQQPQLVGENGVLVTWPRRFVKDVGRDGPLSHKQIAEVARRIAEALPAAVSRFRSDGSEGRTRL